MSKADVFRNLVDKVTTNDPNYSVGPGNTTIQDRFDGVGNRQDAYDRKLKVVADDVNDLVPHDYKKGTYSLMNEHAILTVGNAGDRYIDTGPSLWFDDKNEISPTAKNLITKWNVENPFAPYKIEDFLYAKYYGLIPNNRLITLRRFYRPTFDNMQVHIMDRNQKITNEDEFKKIHSPIATAVTWFGNETDNDLASFLGFSAGFKWSPVTAGVEDIKGPATEYNGKVLGPLFRTLALATGSNDVSRGPYLDQLREHNFWESGPYQNKVYGPINAIYETLKRERGLNFTQSYTVKFHYSLRSINSNNPKVVMLDILSNFLSLCFNFGEFWGGAYRYWPSLVDNPIPGGIGSISQLYTRDADQILSGIKEMGRQLGSGVGSRVSELGDIFGSLVRGDIRGALSSLLSGAQTTGLMQSLLGGLTTGNMSEILSAPPLLTGDPMGEWHITVGNPFNPTLMAGNLVVNEVRASFNNEISFEGFPTEMTFEVELNHGRPREAGDIQSMFNQGNGRTYYYIDDELNPNESASGQNSLIDNSSEMARKFGFDSENGSSIRSRGWGPKQFQ